MYLNHTRVGGCGDCGDCGAMLFFAMAALVPSVITREWCDARLEMLRRLVASRAYEQAAHLSRTLRRGGMVPASCRADTFYSGLADIIAIADEMPKVRLLSDPMVLPVSMVCEMNDASLARTTHHVHVEGLVLNDTFHVSRLASAAAQNLATYMRGSKRMLVVPVCPVNLLPDECDRTFDVGIVTSGFGGDVMDYMRGVSESVPRILQNMSFGQLKLTIDVEAPLRVPGYDTTARSCSSFTMLGWTPWVWQADSVDTLAWSHLKSSRGVSHVDYDFYAIAIACRRLGFSGRGYIGIPGMVLNLVNPKTMDPSLVHELGHNAGLNHGSRMADGERGRAMWETMYLFDKTIPEPMGHREYGSFVTPMGNGRTPEAHFLAPAKIMFGWVDAYDVAVVKLTDECAPCLPLTLSAINVGTRGASAAGSFLAARIETEYAERYFFVEHRRMPNRDSALVVSSAHHRGGSSVDHGGVLSHTVTADTLLYSDDFEPYVRVNTLIRLDIGSGDSPWPMTVRVMRVDMRGNVVVQLSRSKTALASAEMCDSARETFDIREFCMRGSS